MLKRKLLLCKVWYALMPSRCSLLIQRCYPMMLDHLLFSWKILKYTHKVWAFDMFKSTIWTQILLVTVTVSSNCLIIVCLSFAKSNIFLSRGECWNVAFSASGTIQIKWNKDWLWRQGSRPLWWLEDHHMMIWWITYDFKIMTGGCSNDICSRNMWL